MYYIITCHYVGPNVCSDERIDAHTIEISTAPALTNSSHEECTSGWCGTTSDWSVHAFGAYATLGAARAAVIEIFGEVRDCDGAGDPFESDDETVVAVYKPGRYAPMSASATADWACECIRADITADTTDARIAELVVEYEAEANANGGSLHDDLADFMRQHRQELRDERGDA